MIEKQLRCLSVFIVICLVFVIDCACISVSAAGQDQGKDMIESYDLDGSGVGVGVESKHHLSIFFTNLTTIVGNNTTMNPILKIADQSTLPAFA